MIYSVKRMFVCIDVQHNIWDGASSVLGGHTFAKGVCCYVEDGR